MFKNPSWLLFKQSKLPCKAWLQPTNPIIRAILSGPDYSFLVCIVASIGLCVDYRDVGKRGRKDSGMDRARAPLKYRTVSVSLASFHIDPHSQELKISSAEGRRSGSRGAPRWSVFRASTRPASLWPKATGYSLGSRLASCFKTPHQRSFWELCR